VKEWEKDLSLLYGKGKDERGMNKRKEIQLYLHDDNTG
jgi:hypothetical protein